MINEQIRCKEDRVIGEEGQQLGVMALRDALNMAKDAGVDLVMVSPSANPPVCRIVDYGKFKYEQLRREKEKAVESARREAQHIIDEARAAANIASEELKAMRKQLADSADVSGINQRQAELRRNLNEVEDKLRASQPKKERPKPTRGILVGDTVELLKLGTKASVLAINKDGTYQLQAGILKLTAKPDEIYLLENENPYKAKGGHPAHSGREMKMTAMPISSCSCRMSWRICA